MAADFWRKVDLRFQPKDLGLDSCLRKEWLLANGLGGYSSSTIPLMNSRKYHGLLVPSFKNLRRVVCLQKLDEELSVGKDTAELSVNEFSGALKSGGFDVLTEFSFDLNSVVLKYAAFGVEVVKTMRLVNGMNALLVSYSISNTSELPATLKIRVLANSRSIHELSKENSVFSPKVVDSQAFTLKCDSSSTIIYSNSMKAVLDAVWYKNFRYRMEEERGEDSVEDSYSPGYFTFIVQPKSKADALVVAVAGENEAEASSSLKNLLSKKPEKPKNLIQDSGIFTLLSSADSFLIDVESKKSVIAGYHWFGEWGRDSMISLPGVTLVRGKFDDAEKILERFLNRIYAGRIPTGFDSGKPKYHDFDGTLWMIDRVKDYVDYVGEARGKVFLHTYWWNLKDVIKAYGENVKKGILYHKSGTWMDTLSRDNAVEVQGLWYNALKTMEDLAKVMGDKVDYSDFISDFEEYFMAKYWNSNYLNDTMEDDALRPNQLIVLSMDYNVVPENQALKILDIAKSELLTPYGLRTLCRAHKNYAGRYVGSPAEREKAYHNGTVWPWLIGPYVKACMKYTKDKNHCIESLKPLLDNHLTEAGLGTISEIFDGDEPHTPRGCISQAWSVSEVIRTMFEDINPKK